MLPQGLQLLRWVATSTLIVVNEHKKHTDRHLRRGYDSRTATKLAHRDLRSDLTFGQSEKWETEARPAPPPRKVYPNKGFILDPEVSSRLAAEDRIFSSYSEGGPQRRDDQPDAEEGVSEVCKVLLFGFIGLAVVICMALLASAVRH